VTNIYTKPKPIKLNKSGKPIMGPAYTGWKSDIKKKYGITDTEYHQLNESQNYVCAICKGVDDRGARLAIDHCHETNKIRGLLCRKCNVALGYLDDDIALLESALAYLKKHKESLPLQEALLSCVHVELDSG